MNDRVLGLFADIMEMMRQYILSVEDRDARGGDGGCMVRRVVGAS